MKTRLFQCPTRRSLLIGGASAGLGSLASRSTRAETVGDDPARIVFASGSDQASLLELFTSQGCSSCPPADEWLGRLVKDKRLWDQLVPVAWHVDYWDRLGWRDPLGDSAHSERQYAYRKAGRAQSVYTPGFFVDGLEWRGWYQRGPLPARKRGVGKLEGRLDEGGRKLSVAFDPDSAEAWAGVELEAHGVLLGFGIETEVTRGENAGRKLESHFAVLSHARGAIAPGSAAALALPAPRPASAKGFAVAAWVEDRQSRMPVQAAASWFPRGRVPAAG